MPVAALFTMAISYNHEQSSMTTNNTRLVNSIPMATGYICRGGGGVAMRWGRDVSASDTCSYYQVHHVLMIVLNLSYLSREFLVCKSFHQTASFCLLRVE